MRVRLITLWLVMLGGAAHATPPLVPRDVLFGNPEKLSPRISPDGTRLAWLAPDSKNVMQVWVRTIGKTDDRAMTSDAKRGIRQFQWAPSGTMLIYAQDIEGDENWHLYGADLAGAPVRDLTPFQNVRAEWVGSQPGIADQVLVSLNLRDRKVADVYRLTLSSGALVLDTQNPGDVVHFFADAALRVRAAQVSLPSGGIEVRVRDGERAEWRTLVKGAPDDAIQFNAFSADGKSVSLWTSAGQDTARLVLRRLADGRETVIASSDETDAGDVLFDPIRHTVQAVAFAAGRNQWTVVDAKVKDDFAGIARLHDGDFAVIDRDARDRTWLVSFSSDRGPISYWAWDRTAKKGSFLFVHQPKLDGLPLSEMKYVVIRSTDGLKLHSFLTLPADTPPRNLPMVVLVHGGPWMRQAWGYNATAQWLANRGYAVLQLNYRGSSGYGKKFVSASFKEWGKKMQSDLLDGVAWAVQEGIADAKRVAIFGASYGGYAVLSALAFTPTTFACGVDIVGPSNLRSFIQSIPPYWKPLRAMFDVRVGNIDDPQDEQLLRDASPLYRADQITRPLLIGQGAKDPRVKANESEQIVEAIAQRHGRVTYVLYSDEGHGFARPPNRIDFHARAEAFLAGCLGGRLEPLDGQRYPGSTAVVRVVGER
jgi:dipeptidyl aminopeptidase/acylaminoacyl peptidase